MITYASPMDGTYGSGHQVACVSSMRASVDWTESTWPLSGSGSTFILMTHDPMKKKHLECHGTRT